MADAETKPEGEQNAEALAGGSYEVLRARLLQTAGKLREKAEELNRRRTAAFGSSALTLLATERVRTENNCVPRDIRQVQGKLLLGFNVFIGLKSETVVSDVFAVYDLQQNGEHFELPSVPVEAGHYLADPGFVKEFADLYRYNRETKLLQLHTSDTRLLAIFQVGASVRDRKVFRWGIDKGGRIAFVDTRGEDDFKLPRQHDFAFTPCTREDQVSGEHPHYSILDEVFVETVGGDLTIKVENNTKDGRGIYREPVLDANQSLDDGVIEYAKVGALILLKIKPYREEAFRHLVFNTRTQAVVRIDAIGDACQELPEDQGIIFPGGYYLRTGEYKVFDGESRGLTFRRAVKSPNGEDILYVYDRIEDGSYLLLPYNLIKKSVETAIPCHGYSLFDDGKLVVFKTVSDEPTRVHPMQIWQTPFCTPEHAAAAPNDGSYLAKLGNAELVRGISDVLTLERIASADQPSRRTYEDVIASSRRLETAYHWLGHADVGDLASAIADVRKTAELVIDEFEKVTAIKARAADALAEAQASLEELLRGPAAADMRSIDELMGALAALRVQRGRVVQLREMRYVDLAAVDALEQRTVAAFDEVTKASVTFLLGKSALDPLLSRLGGVADKATAAAKSVELDPLREDVDKVGEGLTALSDVVGGLAIEDPTQRTRILEAIGEAFSHLNRARATLTARRKELRSAEGKGEFAAQFKLFGQSVTSALALCDTPERCDAELSRLLLALEELEGKFGEYDEFLGELTDKREEVTEAIAARRQQLLDERQRRAQNLLATADRVLGGVTRKARTLTNAEELSAYFASDAMVQKLRDLAKQLFALGATVQADEVEAKLKTAQQDALRALRDKTELFEDGGDVIKLGRHRFHVDVRPVELALVPRRDEAAGADVQYLHLTGTDFFERIDDAALETARDLWTQTLVSESDDVYRGEFLAHAILSAAERGEGALSLEALGQAGAREGGVLELVRAFAQDRHDEGYERGVHDVDAALLLEKLVAMRRTAGLLRFASDARAAAVLFWATVPEADRAVVHRRARSVGRLRDRLGTPRAQHELAAELAPSIAKAAEQHRLAIDDGTARAASRYLVEELAAERPRFVTSASASILRDALFAEAERAGGRRELDDDLRALEKHGAERLALVRAWLAAIVEKTGDLAAHAPAALEAAVLVVTDRQVQREPSSATTETTASGLFGQHPRIQGRAMQLRLDELLARLDRFTTERAPRFRAFRKAKQELLERERRRLRLDELAPRVLSSFVRNKLIDEVYLPLVGDNLAKQMGAAGAAKRTDLMGLLLLVSPPGYGKTTLMEYVASRLGLVFVKVNGPALGHGVRSLDPKEAPNATARQEVDKINFALEMGNNVMLYLDDIQHTHPELLQKFISLCDAQRRIEGVWKDRTRTYDLRGKRFCVVMAGNPYTESGDKFQIPDMLANRADTYNLGDILEGKGDVFALSFIENALTSNRALAPLAGRERGDIEKLLRMAQGEPVAASELSYPYSAAEVSEMVEVLKRLFAVQKVLLRVNAQYIASASQDDAYRTEPPFKLQGSYRNMNKLAEKVVAAHTPEEIEALVDDHYAGESQTLTTGAEANLLKLAELRGRLAPEQAARWEEIKRGFVRVKRMGGKEDDPVARVTGVLGTLGEQLEGIGKTLGRAVAEADAPAKAIAVRLDKLHAVLKPLGERELLVRVERDPAIAELLAKQLGVVEAHLAPVVKALAEGVAGATREAQARTAAVAAFAAAPAKEAPSGRIEEHLAELTRVVRDLQDRIGQGVAAAAPRPRFEAEIALETASTFYAWKSGADVVREGGVFVATYRPAPALGTTVSIALSLPGGVVIEADAVVEWSRPAGNDGPPWEQPGFGARFVELSVDQQRVVHQFTQARAPILFESK